MFHAVRQNRALQAVVFAVFAWAWLAALGTGVQVRVLQKTPGPVDVCTLEPAPGALIGQHLYEGGNTPAGQAGHHGPDCLLCVALATPSAIFLAGPEPFLSTTYRSRHGRSLIALGWRIQPPLPARGPPDFIHA